MKSSNTQVTEILNIVVGQTVSQEILKEILRDFTKIDENPLHKLSRSHLQTSSRINHTYLPHTHPSKNTYNTSIEKERQGESGNI